MAATPPPPASSGGRGAPNGHAHASRNGGAGNGVGGVLGNGAGPKRRFADPEYIALNELLSSFSGEMDEHHQPNGGESGAADAQMRKRLRAADEQQLTRRFQQQQEVVSTSYQRYRSRRERDADADAGGGNSRVFLHGAPNPSVRPATGRASPSHLTEPRRRSAAAPKEQRSRPNAAATEEKNEGIQEDKDDGEDTGSQDDDEDSAAEEDEVDEDEGSSLALAQGGKVSRAGSKKSSTAMVPAAPSAGNAGGDGALGLGSAASRHTKLTDLEKHVRSLERDNLHLKQALLLGKNAGGRNALTGAPGMGNLGSLSSLAGMHGMGGLAGLGSGGGAPGGPSRAAIQQLLAERTKVVTEMVEQLNATYLSLEDASRVWHKDCRIGVGVREWDALGRRQTISLWSMIRSVFTSIAVDIVELRPHLPDGEMILTKWRIQGEIASAQHLERVCASEDCPPAMRVALMAIKSSDLTFTVTAYVVFQELRIAEQHHCWDQVGVFKRLFGGEIPPSVQQMLAIDDATANGTAHALDV